LEDIRSEKEIDKLQDFITGWRKDRTTKIYAECIEDGSYTLSYGFF